MTNQPAEPVHTYRIDIVPTDAQDDPHLLAEAKHLGLAPTSARQHRYYLVRTTSEEVAVRDMAQQLLADPMLEEVHLVVPPVAEDATVIEGPAQAWRDGSGRGFGAERRRGLWPGPIQCAAGYARGGDRPGCGRGGNLGRNILRIKRLKMPRSTRLSQYVSPAPVPA